MSALPPVDPARCPLCGMQNGCAMAGRTGGGLPTDCWCMGTKFDAQALQDLPLQARGQTCICPRCATRSAPPRPGTPG